MTVSTEVSYNEFTGNGATVEFPTTFGFLDEDHLVVTVITISTGAETIQTLTTHYTVTGEGAATGTVTMLTAPSTLQQLRVERTVPILQSVDFLTAGAFAAETHTARHDYRTQVEQQLARRLADLEAGASSTTVALAGNGLTKSVDTLHVGAGAGIQSNADTVEVLFGVAADLANVTKAAEAAGVLNTAARSDHKHDASTAAPAAAAVAIGNAASEGTATSLSRSDHVHAVTAPAAPANITKAAADAGAATTFARADHKHDASTAAAATITTANAEGTATTLARSDHTHNHGALLGGDRHALAVAATSHGFMSSTDKTKLDGLATETVSEGTVRTADATATTVITWTPTDETAETVEVVIAAVNSTAEQAAGYRLSATFRRNGGTTIQVGATTVVASHEDVAAWNAEILVAASPAIIVRVTGAAGITIGWHVTARRKVATP